MPLFINAFTTSETRSVIRIASSATVIVSGRDTSRKTFSRSTDPPIAFARARSCLRFIAAIERWRPPSRPVNASFNVSLPPRRPASSSRVGLPLLASAARLSFSRSTLRAAEDGRENSVSPGGASTGPLTASGAFFAALAFSAFRRLRSSSSAFALRLSSRSRSSASLASNSARRCSRSAARSASSASRFAASSVSRALDIAKAFMRRANSTSEMPAGRFDGSPPTGIAGPPVAGFAAPGFGTTTRLRLVSTTTFFVRPWLKLCFTLLGREPPRPSGFLPSLSLIWLLYPSRPTRRRRLSLVDHVALWLLLQHGC